MTGRELTVEEPWTDEELAGFLGALALHFAAQPETYPVFAAWVTANEPPLSAAGSPVLRAPEVLARHGRELLSELAMNLLVGTIDSLQVVHQ